MIFLTPALPLKLHALISLHISFLAIVEVNFFFYIVSLYSLNISCCIALISLT